MSITVEQIAENILSRHIDKQQAMDSFERLSDREKNQLIDNLQQRLSGRNPKPRLKAIDQRDLTDRHKKFISELASEYQDFVPKSKANILKHQQYFVDQRRAFHLLKDLKELHFQITYQKAEGAYVYDIDDNKYIDISGDMGVNIFGHKPEFIVNAVKNSLDQGIPLAGYSENIFQAARLFCELTGHERALFTQSGTEAVMFAVRVARAATQKKKVVIFDGAYHGLSDAVVAIKDQDGKSLAMGPGMLQEFADQLIVLDYGDISQLDIIEQQAADIACVLVEPVQSRHPYKQPIEFLKELRKLTIETAIPLIFDEMITGFRICPRGAQGYFDIKADMATYGKIPGGGLPTGVIAGAAKYMDLIDGGLWSFDDDSMPKAKRTGMAGTHSQNPLKIASVVATLSEIKNRCSDSSSCDNCSCFQKQLNEKTRVLSEELNGFFSANNLPIAIDRFGSLFRFRFVDSFWGVSEALLFILLRMKGVETNIQGNCFLTCAHSAEDIRSVIQAVKDSLNALMENDFFYLPEKDESLLLEVPQQSVSSTRENSPRDTAPKETAKLSSGQLAALRDLLKSDLQRFQEVEN